MAGITGTVVDSILKTKFEDLPPETINQVKRVFLDSVGCALGGYAVDRSKIAIELVDNFGGNPEASVIGGHRTSVPLAAFANGELINALDFDVIGPIRGHVVPYSISPTLAMAERVHASGKDLIVALALALEIGGRVIASLPKQLLPKKEPPYWEDAPRFSHVSSGFGGVAGASKLLRLNKQQAANAFGIAGASMPVPAGMKWEHTPGPAIMVKYNAWSGWASQLSTVAALAAEKGFTGDTTILDGEWGFWKICGYAFFKEDVLTKDLGKVWHIGDVEFKPYPCCRNNHACIDGINEIMDKNAIKPEDIDTIVIKGESFLATPNRMSPDVQSFADTQFSNALIAAIAAYYGSQPGPNWDLPTTFNDPRIRALMKKVKVTIHPRADKIITEKIKAGIPPRFHNTIVEIRAGGKTFSADIDVSKGDPSNPLSDAELEQKFRHNASFSPLRTDKVDRAIQAIYDLHKIKDITQLMKLLTVG